MAFRRLNAAEQGSLNCRKRIPRVCTSRPRFDVRTTTYLDNIHDLTVDGHRNFSTRKSIGTSDNETTAWKWAELNQGRISGQTSVSVLFFPYKMWEGIMASSKLSHS